MSQKSRASLAELEILYWLVESKPQAPSKTLQAAFDSLRPDRALAILEAATKYNPNQPRWPEGTEIGEEGPGSGGGRFAPADGHASSPGGQSASAPSSEEVDPAARAHIDAYAQLPVFAQMDLADEFLDPFYQGELPFSALRHVPDYARLSFIEQVKYDNPIDFIENVIGGNVLDVYTPEELRYLSNSMGYRADMFARDADDTLLDAIRSAEGAILPEEIESGSLERVQTVGNTGSGFGELTTPEGDKYFVKGYSNSGSAMFENPKAELPAEYILSGLGFNPPNTYVNRDVGEAISEGIGPAEQYIVSEFVDGEPLYFDEPQYASPRLFEEDVQRQIGRLYVADAILGNGDRHRGNGFLRGDELIPIDHGRIGRHFEVVRPLVDIDLPMNQSDVDWLKSVPKRAREAVAGAAGLGILPRTNAQTMLDNIDYIAEFEDYYYLEPGTSWRDFIEGHMQYSYAEEDWKSASMKYNPDQPRHPEGAPVDPVTGAGGGRFASADGAAASTDDAGESKEAPVDLEDPDAIGAANLADVLAQIKDSETQIATDLDYR